MEFGGRYKVDADRRAVWAALNDAEILKACIPGCSRLEWMDPARLEIEVTVNLGVAKPRFSGELALSDVVPAQSYVLTGHGRGGLLGKAHASAAITLNDLDAGTLLVFSAQGGASGQLMRLGAGLVGNSAQRIVDRFFDRFGTAMGANVTSLALAD